MTQTLNESIVFKGKDYGIGYLDSQGKFHSSFIPLTSANNMSIGYGNYHDTNLPNTSYISIYGHRISLNSDQALYINFPVEGTNQTLYHFKPNQAWFGRYAKFSKGIEVYGQAASFYGGLKSYNKTSYLYRINTTGINIVDSESDSNPTTLKTYIDNRIANHFAGSRVFYATCSTGADKKEKKVRLRNPSYAKIKKQDGTVVDQFVLRLGDQLVVNFVYGNDAPSPILKLYNSDSEKEIITSTDVGQQVTVADKALNGLAGAWSKGEIVTFTYIKSGATYYWKVNNAGTASSTRYGNVRLLKYFGDFNEIKENDRDIAISSWAAHYLAIDRIRKLELQKEIVEKDETRDVVYIRLFGLNIYGKSTCITTTAFDRYKPRIRTSQLTNDGSKNNKENIDGINIKNALYLSSNHTIVFDSYRLGIGYYPRSSNSTNGNYVPDGSKNKIINFLPYDPYGNVKLGYGSFKNDYKTADAPAGSSWRIQKPQSYTKIYGHYIRLYIQSNGRDDHGDLHIDGIYYPYGKTTNDPTIVKLYQFSGTKMRFPPVTWPEGGVGDNHRVVFSFTRYNYDKNEYRPLLDIYNGVRTGRVYASSIYIRAFNQNGTDKTSPSYLITNEGRMYMSYIRVKGGLNGTGFRIFDNDNNTVVQLKTDGTIAGKTLKVEDIVLGKNKNTKISDYIKNIIADDVIRTAYITFSDITYKKSSAEISKAPTTINDYNGKNKLPVTHTDWRVVCDITDYMPGYYPIGISGFSVSEVTNSSISHPTYVNPYRYFVTTDNKKRFIKFSFHNYYSSENKVNIGFFVFFRKNKI